ncbi:Lrp/AsnC family transcriptional regulator [Pseudoroseicyclus aestuarii]|uniref:Lrp/AsnC family leucine-responsive transcriptional regulator n=1 Tax=Pseudoroseicyclus aestuarii TaxID=1795041 RepID=A0A318T1Q1_9RHOB|nr:Lrp/AsnC ligand binding domain-containing protein [Pseudoroseicyclus aestuarii]PYE85907.1 Lrp/AsnC family leucine-responsive transcriptional regulator [Pseudoroseicyclus aestuarii]
MHPDASTTKQTDPLHLDRIDRRILNELMREGRISVTDLAERVGLSRTPCQARLARLQASGAIRGFRAVVDPAVLGRDHVTFVEVRLTDTSVAALEEFNAAVAEAPEIEECYMIAGGFDYLLKVRCADIRDYREILGKVISGLPHVASTSTHVSMQAVKEIGGDARP